MMPAGVVQIDGGSVAGEAMHAIGAATRSGGVLGRSGTAAAAENRSTCDIRS
jgi:hypothetical protein